MTNLLAAALDYAAAGVAVFPARVTIVDGRKRVFPVASWRQASTTNPAAIREWFEPGQPWVTASLCIDCGKSGLVVIDLDVKDGRDGLASWDALITEHTLATTDAIVITPSGGQHWYYREHPSRVVSIDSTGKVAPGVDVRGLGGFVLAWPSVDDRGAYGHLDVDALATAPVVPELVVQRMNARPAPPPEAPSPASLPARRAESEEFWETFTKRDFTFAQAKAFCRPPLDTFRALRTPEDSGFNDRLNALACIWSHFIPAFMTEAQAEAELYEAAVHNRSVEWQGEHAVRATIRSGLRQVSDRWKAVRVEDSSLEAAESELDREVARLHLRADARDRFQAERHARTWAAPDNHGSLADELRLPDEETPWRLKGLLGVGHNAVLVAGRKVGKTTIVNNLIRSYVDGGAFLDRFDITPADAGVAVFNYEVDERQYRRWVREVGIVNSDRVFLLHLRGKSMPLRDAQVRAYVTSWLRERHIGLWIVDPYSRAYVGSVDDGNDEAQVGAFLDTLDVIKAEAGVSELVMPVHTPKARVDAGEETAIGSQRLEAWPDSMWYLTRDFESGLRFLRAEGRDVDVPEEQLTYDEGSRQLVLGGWDRATLRARTDGDALVDFIRANAGCSQNDIMTGLSWGKTRIDKAIRAAGVAIQRQTAKNREIRHYVS